VGLQKAISKPQAVIMSEIENFFPTWQSARWRSFRFGQDGMPLSGFEIAHEHYILDVTVH
jgi:hypothetical protein